MLRSQRSFAMPQQTLFLVAVLLCPILLASVGCTTLDLGSGKKAPDLANVAKYTVEVKPAAGKPRKIDMTLDKVTRLSEALAQSGVAKRYRRMEVYVVRSSAKNGEEIALTAKFDQKKKVTIETDYAIHPNDRVIVKPRF